MYVGSRMQQPISSGELNYGYASRRDSHLMPPAYAKTAYFAPLPNHSSRLFPQTNTL